MNKVYIMQVIKLRKKTSNKIEMIKLIISVYCLISDIKISKTEIEVMAYFMTYGLKKSTKELILRSQILNHRIGIENTVSKLRKAGLIVKDVENRSIINPKLAFNVDNKMGMIIQLDNI